MKKYEKIAYQQNYQLIGGLDEVGRGCIGGPLVCALVILPVDYDNKEINDSKLLSAKKRQELAQEIINVAIDYNIQVISPQVVDQINPKNASKEGMLKCIEAIKTKPDYCLIDFEKLDIAIPNSSITKGDQQSISIAAASIMAKVYRDNMMVELGKQYPNYGFEKHKGYLTKFHWEALDKYGPLPGIHRFSYRPLKKDK
ncbi:MAG: ribonuclease HII [Mycoplasmataceae bacterium]|nr:ribonuclease HII [Mycoplasmataceae bacterium]